MAGKMLRFTLDDICYNDALKEAGLMIVGQDVYGAVFAPRRALPCGHPVTALRPFSCECRACGQMAELPEEPPANGGENEG